LVFAAACRRAEEPLGAVGLLLTDPEWDEQVASGEELFADPAILGAKVVTWCDGLTVSFPVKLESSELSWSREGMLPISEWPRVSLWYAGPRRRVRYEDRLDQATDEPRGIQLILDMDGLAPN